MTENIPNTAHNDDLRVRILMHVGEMFMRFGIRNISMDDIARDLCISKKTIYQVYKDKAALVMEIARLRVQSEQALINRVLAENECALTALVILLQEIAQTLRTLPPMILFEIQKYYPEVWQVLREQDDHFHIPCLCENIKKGISQGVFRENIQVETIARFRMGMIDIALDGKRFPSGQFNPSEVMIEISNFYLYGLLTEKGLKKLKSMNLMI